MKKFVTICSTLALTLGMFTACTGTTDKTPRDSSSYSSNEHRTDAYRYGTDGRSDSRAMDNRYGYDQNRPANQRGMNFNYDSNKDFRSNLKSNYDQNKNLWGTSSQYDQNRGSQTDQNRGTSSQYDQTYGSQYRYNQNRTDNDNVVK